MKPIWMSHFVALVTLLLAPLKMNPEQWAVSFDNLWTLEQSQVLTLILELTHHEPSIPLL